MRLRGPARRPEAAPGRAGRSATGACSTGILREAGARSPWDLDAARFNSAAERFYRGTLRERQLAEACELFAAELHHWSAAPSGTPRLARELSRLLGVATAEGFLEAAKEELAGRRPQVARLRAWIELVVLSEASDEELRSRPETWLEAEAPARSRAQAMAEGPCPPTSTWTAPPAAS